MVKGRAWLLGQTGHQPPTISKLHTQAGRSGVVCLQVERRPSAGPAALPLMRVRRLETVVTCGEEEGLT